MLAFSQLFGIRLYVRDWIKITVRIGAISFAQNFRILVGMLSGRDTLHGSRVSKRFCTPSHETAISGIRGCGVLLQFDMSVVFS